VSDVCNGFSVVVSPPLNAMYEIDGVVTFSWHGASADTPMSISITRHGQVDGLRADNITDLDGLLPISLKALGDPGVYDWKIWLQHSQYGAICTYSGAFIKLPFRIL
jgi:hypothetical protein